MDESLWALQNIEIIIEILTVYSLMVYSLPAQECVVCGHN